jgi:hypothetical protein
MTCDHCGMYYPETKTCFGCLMEKPCESPERCGTPVIHACPEPYDAETARYLLVALRGSVTTQERIARMLLGLEAAGDIERCAVCGRLHEPGTKGRMDGPFPGIEFKACPNIPEGHIYEDREFDSGPRGALHRLTNGREGE